MLDPSQRKSLKVEPDPRELIEDPDWSKFPVERLISYMSEIRKRLPPLSIAEINLEEQLLMQYHSLQELFNEVRNDDKTPVNQRAQVANSLQSALANLTKLQMDVYSSERLKMIEKLIIRMLRTLPEEAAVAFLDDYEAALKDLK